MPKQILDFGKEMTCNRNLFYLQRALDRVRANGHDDEKRQFLEEEIQKAFAELMSIYQEESESSEHQD